MIRWIILASPSVNLWWPKEGAEASALAEQLTHIVRAMGQAFLFVSVPENCLGLLNMQLN